MQISRTGAPLRSCAQVEICSHQLLSDSRLDNLTIQMPGRVSEYWHHDGEADETWRRADRQAAGDDEPPGGRSFHENSVPGIDAE
jgi:hypothetical protein